MPAVVLANDELLDRILDATFPLWHDGLTRANYRRFYAAQARTAWGQERLRVYALVDGPHLLSSLKRYDLAAVIAGRETRVCGLGAVFTDPAHRGHGHAAELIDRVLADARENGAALGLLFSEIGPEYYARRGFEVIPRPAMSTVRVSESPRYGAPMTMIRVGDARDLGAIATMGRTRAAGASFHLERDVAFIQYGITKKRLLAGLGRAGERELQFFIAEEGTTAAAYVVVSVAGAVWTVEECGDRDATGARVGAILQALIAREPGERRPSISAWLPAGFAPPQLTLGPARPSASTMMMRSLDARAPAPRLSSGDVLYWEMDVF